MEQECENKQQLEEYHDKYQIQRETESNEKALENAKERADQIQETTEYLKLGDACRLMNQFQMAIKYYEEALEIVKERKDQARETTAYLGLGHAYRMNNQFQMANEYYKTALEIAKEGKDEALETTAYLALGLVYRLNNQFQTAIEYYEKALEIAKERYDQAQETTTYLRLGDVYRLNNQFQMAIEYCQQALEIAKERKDQAQDTTAYIGLGHAYRRSNQFQTAIEYYEQALEIAKERKNQDQKTTAYLGLGLACRMNNQFQMANEYYETALKIAREGKDEALETTAYLGLGLVYRLNNQFQTAIEYYEKALEIAKERYDQAQETTAYLRLGDAYRLNNQFQMAIEYCQQALEIAKERKDQAQETTAYIGLGHAYRRSNQFQTAIEYYEHALEIAKERKDQDQETTAYLRLGYAYRMINQSQTAIEYYAQALEIAKERKDQDQETTAYLRLGNAYSHRQINQFQTAIEYYEQALEIAKERKDQAQEITAYLRLGRAYRRSNQFQTAIEYYEQALKTAKERKDQAHETKAYLRLGSAYKLNNQFQMALEHYAKAMKIAEELEDKHYENIARNASEKILRIADAVDEDKPNTNSIQNSISSNNTRLQDQTVDNIQETEAEKLHDKGCKLDATVKSCLEVQENSYDLGEGKEEVNNAYLMLGDNYQELKQHEEAIESYQKTLDISKELGDKEMQIVAIQRLGTLYLTLASVCSKECDYGQAVQWYKKVLDISGTERDEVHLLHEKALIGLGVAWLNIGDTEKAIEYIRKARRFAVKKADTDSENAETTHDNINSAEQKPPPSPVPDLGGKEENVLLLQETKPVTERWAQVDALIEEMCNPSTTERLTSEKLVTMEKYIKEIAPSYVYTRQISIEEPFTKNVRKAMSDNVKNSAYTSLFGKNDHKLGRKDGKLVNGDQEIFNFARDEVFKNASTKRPARLNETLTSSMRSIGQIKCGTVRGTCFLVTDELVLTNYHVYRMIETERNESGNFSLPITVLFDYFHAEHMENVVVEAEVDEEQDPKLSNPYVDYKFFRLKQNEDLADRVPLGPMVRNWQLSDGRVVILGHPEGKELQDEVCIVVGYREMHETIRKRHEQCNGVHMTNAQLLHKTEEFQGRLSYDTTFFSGASGSPVFEMNGNIVAIHTQGYQLEILEDDTPNQSKHVWNQELENGPNAQQESVSNPEQENVPNQEQESVPNQKQENVLNQEQRNVPNQEQGGIPNQKQENISNQEQQNVCNQEQENDLNQELEDVPNQDHKNVPNQEQESGTNQKQENISKKRKYSLMEFGVQFLSICGDLRRWHGENIVKQIFPNYKLNPGEEPMDAT